MDRYSDFVGKNFVGKGVNIVNFNIVNFNFVNINITNNIFGANMMIQIPSFKFSIQESDSFNLIVQAFSMFMNRSHYSDLEQQAGTIP